MMPPKAVPAWAPRSEERNGKSSVNNVQRKSVMTHAPFPCLGKRIVSALVPAFQKGSNLLQESGFSKNNNN